MELIDSGISEVKQPYIASLEGGKPCPQVSILWKTQRPYAPMVVYALEIIWKAVD